MLVKEMSEFRIMHNMAIEDENWQIDERLRGSKPDRLKGCLKFFDSMPNQLSSVLDRKASFLGESSFKDFRDYTKGSRNDFQVANILYNLDKHSHFGSIHGVIKRNVQYKVDGKRNIRQQAEE